LAARVDAPPAAAADGIIATPTAARRSSGPSTKATSRGTPAAGRQRRPESRERIRRVADEPAADVANTEIVNPLLAGANADSPNQDGQTALMAVART
jgi:hypothetical protein